MGKWKIAVVCIAVIVVVAAIYTILYYTSGFIPAE